MSEEAPKEIVIRAAVRYKDAVHTGSRHHPSIRFELRHSIAGYSPAMCVDGFMTSTGRFVNRREAAQVAMKAGQTFGKHIDFLYSEDIQ
jgi:hypothetical protein